MSGVAISAGIVAVLVAGPLTACASAPSTAAGAPHSTPYLTPTPTQNTPYLTPTPTQNTPYLTPTPTQNTPYLTPTPTQSQSPQGEIWQWAQGRNVWTDPYLEKYARGLGRTWEVDVNVQSEGFELALDTSGAVTAVNLYNNESTLGLPGQDTNFRAYEGNLPAGLSWSDTTRDILNKLGRPDSSYTAGYGTEASLTYSDWDGYSLEITLAARHQQELPSSPMHSIKVSRA